MKKTEIISLIENTTRKILKEWFPGKEEFREIEDLYKQQKQIYNDAADAGLMFTPELDNKIKRILNELRSVYGGKASKWFQGSSYTVFIPIEHNERDIKKFDGVEIVVSLNLDKKLKTVYRKESDRFYSIEINKVSGITQDEAKRKYKSKDF
jgi:hypothetical protein